MNNDRVNIHSKYKAKISFDDYLSVNDILVSYYLPIIKSEAFSLYSALVIDSRNAMINSLYVPIERLVSMLNLSLDKIMDGISRLEIVNLLEVCIEDDNIVFIVKRPLSPQEFNNSEQFRELLSSSAGKDNIEINNKLFNSMKDTSINSNNSSTKGIDISDKIEVAKATLNVEYDFTSIKNILNAKQIDWSAFWTKELEDKLLNVIVIYKINSFDVAIELIKEIESGKFDIDHLITSIREKFIKNEDIDSIISAGENTTEIKLDFLSQLSVRDYFIHKLNRVPSPTEEKMITKLINSYGLNNYQINILVDYSIIVNEGAINKNYIFKIADTILKEKLDSPERLIQHLKVSYKLRSNNENETKGDSLKLMEDKPIF